MVLVFGVGDVARRLRDFMIALSLVLDVVCIQTSIETFEE